jgi:HTH-type transcriptional regulator/antitoxin HigA
MMGNSFPLDNRDQLRRPDDFRQACFDARRIRQGILEKMSVTAEIIDEKEYAGLLSQTLPHVIHTEEENERCVAALEALLDKGNKTTDEVRLAELLTLLIEDFEERSYSLPPASPVEVIRHLMDVNDLRQMDLLDVFGTASVVSEVLSGKRDLAKTHIEKLSARFHVSPEVFFPARHGR